ncbi:hypothetical protein BDR06DRAFT_976240 [Suillus hirtellus]|nr:hypothetical protein BDR06DRAFT_976240 [Suillus hirtellus]
MFRKKSAYPVYMTIGNIPKEMRRKPSQWAWILLAYHQPQNLNISQTMLQDPLRVPGEDGVAMASGDGVVCQGHPIVACYSADYPEQLLTTGIKSRECPKCDVPHKELGSPDVPVKLCNLEAIVAALSLIDEDYDLWR